MNTRSKILLCLLLFVCALSALTLPTVMRKAPTAKHSSKEAEMLVLESPNQSRTAVVFSSVVGGQKNDQSDARYQVISLRDATGHENVISDIRGRDEAYSPAGQKSRWSPDGNYLVVLDYENLAVRPIQSLIIIGLQEQDFVQFATASGQKADASNFNGWFPAKPHSMRLVTTSKSQPYAEAGPQ